VVVGSSQSANVEVATRSLGDRASADTIDVKAEATVARFFGKVGPFDHLVFTAGDWGGRAPRAIAETDLGKAADLFAVRFWGALAAIKHAAPLIRGAGSITLTNEHLTRGLAVDLAPIRVNAVCPGAIRTDVWNAIPSDDREARMKQMTERLPIARIGEPNEVAEAYLYLMKAGYTTGQVLLVDGGGSVV
jgi:NAD(P)-dependent dehydrogenase (short-subunit alcohol dehydrogenase family)